MSLSPLKVAVVAPAGAVLLEKLEPGLTWLRERGAEPILGPNLLQQYRHFAGTRAQRLSDLIWALTDPQIDLVWFARGGSGTAQLLPDLPWHELKHPRPVIGFSDATALLISLARHGWESIHGPVLTSFSSPAHPLNEASRESVAKLLFSHQSTPLPGHLLCGPELAVQGPVLGGNLTVLASIAGTSWQLNAQGAIVVLEDISEAPYRLERSLIQLLQSGSLSGAKGVALGEFTDCEPPKLANFQLSDFFIEHLKPLGIPVVAELPVGHGRHNLAFRYGGVATLDQFGLIFADPTQIRP